MGDLERGAGSDIKKFSLSLENRTSSFKVPYEEIKKWEVSAGITRLRDAMLSCSLG